MATIAERRRRAELLLQAANDAHRDCARVRLTTAQLDALVAHAVRLSHRALSMKRVWSSSEIAIIDSSTRAQRSPMPDLSTLRADEATSVRVAYLVAVNRLIDIVKSKKGAT
jgi:hypothetical protein